MVFSIDELSPSGTLGQRGAGWARERPGSPDESSRFPYLTAWLVSLMVGLASVFLLPRSLAFDPWSWLVWGRELDHLALTTRGSGSSFKPLAVLVTAILAPTGGSVAPWLWLALARAAFVFSVALAFALARVRQGPLAGVLAAAGLVTLYEYTSYLALSGMSEPMVVASSLAALESALRGRRGAALAWLTAASLLELELVAVLALYFAVVVIWPSPRRLRDSAALVVLLVGLGLCWFLPDLVSAGNALRSVSIAKNATLGGPELDRFPFAATLGVAQRMMFRPVLIGWLGELAVGGVVLLRQRRRRPMFAPALLAAGFVIGCALLTQMHKMTGNPRFMDCAAAVASVAAACFWVEAAKLGAAWVARLVDQRRAASRSLPAIGSTGLNRLVLAGVVTVLLAASVGGFRSFTHQLRGWLRSDRVGAVRDSELARAVTQLGGAVRIFSCKPVETLPLMVPAVAWQLGVPANRVGDRPQQPTGILFTVPPLQPSTGARYRMKPVWGSVSSPLQVASSCRL